MKYRHEWKHEINVSDVIAIRQRLRAVARMDEHTLDGKYFVRSLYFDNSFDKVLREKIDGINKREKFRIRYYNGDTSLIHLEKKTKMNGVGYKEQAELTESEIKKILDGNIDWMMKSQEPLIQELYTKMRSQGLKPKTIVDYTREAFTYAPGNVRITLDYDIRTGLQVANFLNYEGVTLPVKDAPIILEVKWDEYLPSVIRDVIQLDGRRTSAFSKYAVCRIYG